VQLPRQRHRIGHTRLRGEVGQQRSDLAAIGVGSPARQGRRAVASAPGRREGAAVEVRPGELVTLGVEDREQARPRLGLRGDRAG